MDTRIFLIGFMGSGKSTLGKKLARILDYTHVDTDRMIEDTSGMTIPGIFREHGEPIFRKWERDILAELCLRERVVVSTGGGAPCHGDLMQLMNLHGTTVYIRLTASALKDRLVRSRTERPLIKGKTDGELDTFIAGLLTEREPYYAQAAVTVDGLGTDAESLAGKLRSLP